MTTKRCRTCGADKPASQFRPRRGSCRDCQNQKAREYYALNRAAVLARQRRGRYSSAAWLRQRYGLSNTAYDSLVTAQDGRCAICRCVPPKLVVDHDHVSGKVRALLCERCNCGIGHFRDSAALCRAAAEYARRHRPDV